MKKIISLIGILLIIMIFCSCSVNGNIASIKIDDVEYKNVYLYSFKDAQINEFSSTIANIIPTESGYIYSTEKLSPGDSIKVWEYAYFGDNDLPFMTSSDMGTTAVVDKIIEVYPIQIKKVGSNYKITYYEWSTSIFNTVSNKQDLREITEQKIEIDKQRVIIKYE